MTARPMTLIVQRLTALPGDPTYGTAHDAATGSTVLPATLEPNPPVVPAGEYTFTRYDSPKWGYPVWRCDTIPGHTAIEIHMGNYERDTEGCLVVGSRIDVRARAVWNSADAFDRLMGWSARASVLNVRYIDATGAAGAAGTDATGSAPNSVTNSA